jgi:hypothetical protein
MIQWNKALRAGAMAKIPNTDNKDPAKSVRECNPSTQEM